MPSEGQHTRGSFVRDVLPVIVAAGAIVGFSSIPGKALPIFPGWHADKLAHAAEFGVLGVLVARMLARMGFRHRPGTVLGLALLGTSLWGAVDEVHQLFVPFRVSDWRDWVADTVGGFLGAYGYVRLRVTQRAARGAEGPAAVAKPEARG